MGVFEVCQVFKYVLSRCFIVLVCSLFSFFFFDFFYFLLSIAWLFCCADALLPTFVEPMTMTQLASLGTSNLIRSVACLCLRQSCVETCRLDPKCCFVWRQSGSAL